MWGMKYVHLFAIKNQWNAISKPRQRKIFNFYTYIYLKSTCFGDKLRQFYWKRNRLLHFKLTLSLFYQCLD